MAEHHLFRCPPVCWQQANSSANSTCRHQAQVNTYTSLGATWAISPMQPHSCRAPAPLRQDITSRCRHILCNPPLHAEPVASASRLPTNLQSCLVSIMWVAHAHTHMRARMRVHTHTYREYMLARPRWREGWQVAYCNMHI